MPSKCLVYDVTHCYNLGKKCLPPCLVTAFLHINYGPSQCLATPRQNVYACARLSISGLFFSHTFQSDQSLPCAFGFILCAAYGSVVLLHAALAFDYFVVIEIAFMGNQAQITETVSRLDSEKVS